MANNGLRPFTRESKPGELYYDSQTGELWQTIGWITQPAAILVNTRSGERHIEVIGCPNAERFAFIGQAPVLEGKDQQ